MQVVQSRAGQQCLSSRLHMETRSRERQRERERVGDEYGALLQIVARARFFSFQTGQGYPTVAFEVGVQFAILKKQWHVLMSV